MTISRLQPARGPHRRRQRGVRRLEARHSDPDRRRDRQRRHPPLRSLRRWATGRSCRARGLQRHRPSRAVSERGRHGRRAARRDRRRRAHAGGQGRRLGRQRRRPPASGSRSTTHRRSRREVRASWAGRAGGPAIGSRCAGRTRAERFAPIARAVYRALPGQRRQQQPERGRERPQALRRGIAQRPRRDHDRQPRRPGRGHVDAAAAVAAGRRRQPEPGGGGQGQRARLRRHAADRCRVRRRGPRRSRAAERARGRWLRRESPAARSKCAAPASRCGGR